MRVKVLLCAILLTISCSIILKHRKVTFPEDTPVHSNNGDIDIHAPGKNFIKGKAYAPMNIDPSRPNLAFTPHKQEHGRRRRIIGQGFSDTAMREAETIIMDHINDLCSRLLEKEEDFRSTSIDPSIQVTDTWTAPKNMANWSQLFVCSVNRILH